MKEGIIYDLEDRTTEFAKRIIRLCKFLPSNQINNPFINQILRSSSSVGANYREANDALGKNDFIYRMKISRKEAKETIHWLKLIEEANPNITNRLASLKTENQELINIFSSIIKKVEVKKEETRYKKQDTNKLK